MAEVKITDLVDPKTIQDLKDLSAELVSLLDQYTKTAKELAKGVDINVKVIGDVDKLEQLLIVKSKEAAVTTGRLNEVINQQRQIVADTTNTIQRQLMAQERVNKTQRETYTEHERVKNLLEAYHDTYEGQVESLVKINGQLAANKKAQNENEKALSAGRISMSQYNSAQAELITKHRALTQEKRRLTQIMTAEEKAAQSPETSYARMSQQLELLKKAYKELSEEGRESPFGKELEAAVQNLDAHLKDVAADMGEFQRNVGNYAIAGQRGVVSTESLMAALKQQAVTTKDISDQSKILMEARSMLDTSDAGYAETVALINEKLAENSRKLSDVSDIMDVHATSVAEAEAQNKRLTEALKLVDQSAEDAQSTINSLNAKIEENNKVISAANGAKASVKKDLKELVMEIANLSIEYQNLSDEEKASAEGQALAEHIRQLTEDAGVLKGAIADTNAAITNAASDTRGFDQLGGTLQLAIDGFGLAAGAAEMLGISEGELAQIQTKLQAAIAASNAMSKIQNALQKQSAVIQAAAAFQTKMRAKAEAIHTAAQGKGVIATKAATAAQWAFNAAANANPIGLIVVTIVALVGAVWGLTKAFNAFVGTSEKVKKALNEQKIALDEMGESNQREIERMKARGATDAEIHKKKLVYLKAELVAREKYFERIKRYYKKDSDEYKEALDGKKKAREAFGDYLEDDYLYILGVIKTSEDEERRLKGETFKYKMDLLEKELKTHKEIANALLKEGKIKKAEYKELIASLEKATSIKMDSLKEDEFKKAADNAKKYAEDLKKAVQAGEDALLQIIDDSLERERKAEELAFDRKLTDLEDQLSRLGEKEVQKRRALSNQIQGLIAEHQRKLQEIEQKFNDRRLQQQMELNALRLAGVKKCTQEEFGYRMESLELQQQKELSSLERNLADGTVRTEDEEAMRLAIVRKYARLRQEAEEDFANERANKIQERYSVESIQRNEEYNKAVNALKSRYAQEYAAAENNAKKREALKLKLEKDLYEIEAKYAKKSLENTIYMLQETLKLEKLSIEERVKLNKQLADAKMDLADLVTENAIYNAEEQAETDTKLQDLRIKNIEKWAEIAKNTLSNIGNLTDAIFDRKIQKIEDDEEANEEAGQREQDRITELVNKKVITEEEGEARKRAAEAESAKKTEEIERKKAKLKQKQAIFDKSLAVANLGIDTAAALMKLWVAPGWPTALPMMALVSGFAAMQLATILATPIPKYAKGTDHHKGGPAIVGDGGRQELVVFKGSAWLTPDTPTLIDMPAGASVIPSVNSFDPMTMPVITLPEYEAPYPMPLPYDDTKLIREIKELKSRFSDFCSLIKAQTKQQHLDNYLAQYEAFKKRL